jgi:hypothetical protein
MFFLVAFYMLRKGDVITFPYVGLDHEGVITGMTPLSDNLSEVVKVTVVHFNYAGLFGQNISHSCGTRLIFLHLSNKIIVMSSILHVLSNSGTF